tara:strand:- start:3010 stop:3354 length:345 start_codon:yes stop_codon:yes gene_type:complete
MKSRLGITNSKYRLYEGKYLRGDYIGGSYLLATINNELPYPAPKEMGEENAKLILDAFETSRKTDLLPSELLEQRDKLITEIKKLREEFRMQAPCELYSEVHPYKTSGKLIKSI